MTTTLKRRKRVRPPKLADEEARFALWLQKQILISQRMQAMEREMEELRHDMKMFVDHFFYPPTHIPPEVLNPDRDAPPAA